ncbi:MAG: helix-turn-helix domain-containing protein [Candidatus Bathyarchaeota archaeon]|nr:helix-turn-helix domain-containing protein [Candidatus Bathyarchaeota archaeon]
MEKLGNLMFELANEDRLRILIRLQEKPMRLTQISNKLKLNMQETSRHLSRLSEAGLVSKDSEGRFRIQPFGEEILTLMDGFEFLEKHRDYFNSHDISELPLSFRYRIGELKTCVLSNDFFTSLHLTENLIRRAEKYLWMISDQVLVSSKPLAKELIEKRTTKFRWILLEDLIPPPDFEPLPFVASRMERKTLKKIDVAMAITEKEAQLAFRGIDGKIDFRAFSVVDPLPLNWCKELHEYYWTRAKIGRPKAMENW